MFERQIDLSCLINIKTRWKRKIKMDILFYAFDYFCEKVRLVGLLNFAFSMYTHLEFITIRNFVL